MVKIEGKNLLFKTKCYLVGHMQYVSGRNWREEVSEKLAPLSITCFDPYKKLCSDHPHNLHDDLRQHTTNIQALLAVDF